MLRTACTLDFLGRSMILAMKKILITGSNGQLGRALDLEYREEDVFFIRTDVAESDGIIALDITKIAFSLLRPPLPLLLHLSCQHPPSEHYLFPPVPPGNLPEMNRAYHKCL